MADDSVEIKFVINSSEVMDEYKELVSGSKDVDKATESLKEKYNQMTAAQAMNAKGAANLSDTLKNVGAATKNIDTSKIEVQQEAIKKLQSQISSLNQELKQPITDTRKNEILEDTSKLRREIVAASKELENLKTQAGSSSVGVKFSIEGLTSENLNRQKGEIREIEAALKDLNAEIKKTAPGEAQVKLLSERDSIRKELDAEKKTLSELENAVKSLTGSKTTLQTQYRNTINQMRELEMAGKKDSSAYKDLEKAAIEYKNAMVQVEAEQRLLVSGNVLQGYVQGLSILSGGLSAVQGATALFVGENENLQKIMLRVQSLMAITIGLQQIQQGLTTTSAFRIQVLVKVKNLWAIANARVTASLVALGIAETAATVAAQVLMATLTLGLSVAIIGIIALIDKMQTNSAKLAEEQKKLASAIAEAVAEPLTAYKKLQLQWENLGDSLQKKKKFVTDNKDEFHKLGVEVVNVGDAENLLVKHSDTFIEVLKLRAQAAAEAQVAMENYKKSIEMQDDIANYNKVNNDPNNAWIYKKAYNLWNGDPYEKQKALYDKADQGINNQAALLEIAQKKFEEARLKTYKTGKEKTKKEHQRQMAEIFPEGSIKDLERRVALYNEAIDKGVNGMVKLQKLDQFGQSKDKKGNPYYTGEVVTDAEARSRRNKLETELEEKKNAAKYRSFEEMISDMERKWQKYYQYQKEYGTDAANRQFPELKKQAEDFFDYLETQKGKFDDIINSGGTLTEGQQKNKSFLEDKIKSLRGDKTDLENYTRTVEVALDKIPLLVDQMAYLEAEMLKAEKSGEKRDGGMYAMLAGKWEDKKQELTNLTTEFINAHQSLEAQKTKITSYYAALRAKIEKQGLSPEETAMQIAALNQKKQNEIDAASDSAFQQTEIYKRLSENLIGITRNQLRARIEALKEVLKEEEKLTPEQKDDFKNKLKEAQDVQANNQIQQQINIKIKEREKLEKAAGWALENDHDLYVKLKADIEGVNNEISSLEAEKWQQYAEWAKLISSAFSSLASAVGDSNEELADTFDTISAIADISSNLSSSISGILDGLANKFTQGGIVGIAQGVIGAVGGLLSLGAKARESERKAREEMKKYQDSIFQSGLDYQALLRQRLVDELKINDAYKARVTNIKEEMALNAKNKESILRDQEAVLKRLLNADTVVGKRTYKTGFIFRKTKVEDINQKVGDLLGLQGYKNDPFAGLSDFMKRFMGIKNNPWANLFPSPETVAVSDKLLDDLAKINAEKPLTGDAKTAYEQLLKLKEEYGSIDQHNRDLEKQLKDAVTGTTAQSIADSIKQGILSGKRQFSDFADDIEGFLRQGIIAGMSEKVIEKEMQNLQDYLAEALADGQLSEDERKEFQKRYMEVVDKSRLAMDALNQAGINMESPSGSVNSLQGAYKAASQESIDLLSGQTSGMRVAQLETNQILKAGAAQQMAQTSKMLEVQIDIEKNTRRTAENTEELYDINEGIKKVDKTLSSQYNQLKAAGLK